MTTKPCPTCGAPMTVEVGQVEETVYRHLNVGIRKTRLARWWSCETCDHCEEDHR